MREESERKNGSNVYKNEEERDELVKQDPDRTPSVRCVIAALFFFIGNTVLR